MSNLLLGHRIALIITNGRKILLHRSFLLGSMLMNLFFKNFKYSWKGSDYVVICFRILTTKMVGSFSDLIKLSIKWKKMKDSTYITTDLPLVACLLLRGCVLTNLRKGANRQAVFELEYSDELQRVVAEYFNFNCNVDAQSFLNRLKALKSQISSNFISH